MMLKLMPKLRLRLRLRFAPASPLPSLPYLRIRSIPFPYNEKTEAGLCRRCEPGLCRRLIRVAPPTRIHGGAGCRFCLHLIQEYFLRIFSIGGKKIFERAILPPRKLPAHAGEFALATPQAGMRRIKAWRKAPISHRVFAIRIRYLVKLIWFGEVSWRDVAGIVTRISSYKKYRHYGFGYSL